MGQKWISATISFRHGVSFELPGLHLCRESFNDWFEYHTACHQEMATTSIILGSRRRQYHCRPFCNGFLITPVNQAMFFLGVSAWEGVKRIIPCRSSRKFFIHIQLPVAISVYHRGTEANSNPGITLCRNRADDKRKCARKQKKYVGASAMCNAILAHVRQEF